jgi:hypothetical protein
VCASVTDGIRRLYERGGGLSKNKVSAENFKNVGTQKPPLSFLVRGTIILTEWGIMTCFLDGYHDLLPEWGTMTCFLVQTIAQNNIKSLYTFLSSE